MPRQLSDKQLETLRQQQVEIAKRIKEAEAEGKRKHRENELRRETIVGRLVLNYLAENPDSTVRKAILTLIDRNITRAADRRLFPDLPAAAGASADQ